MFNCLNCDSSKKLVDTEIQLLDRIQADVKKVMTARIKLILGFKYISSSLTIRPKRNDCSNCNWLTKVCKNVNCSTQVIVKKMVYIYGS
jgi:hypothetical protein